MIKDGVYTECDLEELFAKRPAAVREAADRELRDLTTAKNERTNMAKVAPKCRFTRPAPSESDIAS